MPDIISRVRFIGDSSQLLATYRTIGAQSQALQTQLNNAVRTNLRGVGLDPGTDLAQRFFNQKSGQWVTQYTRAFQSAGPIIKNLRAELDSVNKTFRVTGDTALIAGNGMEFLTGKYEGVLGNSDEVLRSAEKLNRIYAQTQPIRNQTRAIIENAKALRAQGQALRYSQFGLQAPAGRNAGSFATLSQIKAAAIEQQRALLNNLGAITATRAAYTDLQRAYTSTPPLPKAFLQLQQYPKLLSELTKRGLPTDPLKLYASNLNVDFTRDLVTGVTKARGAFDLDGVTQNFAAELDDLGRPITRFGRNMSGLQNLLRQTVANFQKVIQWTIATTVVFGGLAAAVSQLSSITQLDKILKQLGVTAQLTSEETKGLFNDIADIAYQTATPLQELLKATDDIALAVRKAGQSTEEYRTNILNLAEAVGIYTNLTGSDTVKATDTLVATMKQLNLESGELIGLLSKITAVSGGQSNAIQDVSTGLGAMAEAARQAGLDVDETIATVQVLSQVTSKTPSEVATAFKNLVGALDSRAGTKALEEFNINLKDGAGNLRNILDVYGEIADKIRQGIIPESEVKALVKAIAGGPRRAPDAAALLSAIGDIEEVRARSERASNEAIIANAKVIDTISARLTKLKVQIDRFVFNKFGEGLKGAVDSLLGPVETLIELLNKLDTGFIQAAIQVGALFLAIRVGAAGLGFFKNQVLGLTFTMAGLAAAYKEAAVSATTYGVAQNSIARTGFNLIGGGKGLAAIGLGAAAGAGLSGLTGGNPLAGALTGAGTAALVAPIPLPWLKLAGAISLAAGTLLEFASNSDQASKSSEQTAQELEQLLNAFDRYKEAVDIIKHAKKIQEELGDAIQERQSKEKKTAEDLTVLADLQKQYVENTLEMVDANKQLAESLALIQITDPSLALDAAAAARGEFDAATLQKKIDEYVLKYLQKTDAGATLEDVQIPKIPTNPPTVPRDGTEILNYKPPSDFLSDTLNFGGPRLASFNIDQLKADSNLVKQIFNDTFTAIDTDIPASGEFFDAISAAIAELAINGDSAAPAMKRVFDQFLIGADAVRGAQVILDKFQQRLEIIKVLDPKQAAELQKVKDLVSEIVTEAARVGDTETSTKVLGDLSKVFAGELKISDEYLKGLAQTYIDVNGIVDKNVTLEQLINGVLEGRNITLQAINEQKQISLELTDDEIIATQEALDSMNQMVASIQASNAERTAGLQAQINSGELKGPELKNAEQQIAQLNAISEGIARVNEAYQVAAAEGVGDLDAAMQDLSGNFTDIMGLQDAQGLSTSQLIERMFSLAETYGLTGQEVIKLGDKLVNLIDIIKRVAAIKATFGIKADVDLSSAIRKLQAMRNALYTFMLTAARAGFGSPSGFTTGAVELQKLDSAIAELKGAQSFFGGFTIGGSSTSGGTGINSRSPSTSGSGSRSSGGGGFNAGPDVSLIDIPDAIAQAYNRDALIQEAIRRAKALQSKIPGAAKEAKNDIVEVMLGTQRLIEVRGVKDDLLRRALEELADIEKKRLEFETKADTIRRIRVGAGDFAALANVPLNTRTGVSVGSAQGPISVNLNINGQLLTPAQFAQLADQIAAAIKRQLGA